MTAKHGHSAVNMSRPMVDGKPRYQVLCQCGRLTEVGSRRDVDQEQRQHKFEEKRKARERAS